MKWIYWLGWLLFRSMARALLGFRVQGRENLVLDGAVLVASNHESFLDPPLMGIIHDTEMHFLARKTLFAGFRAWLLPHWNAVPVDQDRPDMTSLKNIIRKLRDGQRVLVFPEGERTHDGEFGEAAPGIGLLAIKAGVVIQPMRISGARAALPRGSARVRFSRVTVHVGPPIRLTPEELKAPNGKEDYDRLAKRIMAAIAAL